MEKEKQLIELACQIRQLAQNGLVYSENEYDIDRYSQLLEISHRISATVGDTPLESIKACFHPENDYVTPKVDIRAVVFDEEKRILLVRERADGCWSLPGGWADIGYSPKEIAVKEVREETGLDVKPVRLLAVLDKKCHNHPPAMHYAYKIFILCEITGGSFTTAFDILDKGFFAQNELPPLSSERILKSQIDLMFEYLNDPDKKAVTD